MLQQKCASGQKIRPDGRNDQAQDGVHRKRAHEDKIPATTSQMTRTHRGVGKGIYLHHLAATATFSLLFTRTISTTPCKQDSKTLSCCSRRAHQDKNPARTAQTTRNERACTAEGHMRTKSPPRQPKRPERTGV